MLKHRAEDAFDVHQLQTNPQLIRMCAAAAASSLYRHRLAPENAAGGLARSLFITLLGKPDR